MTVRKASVALQVVKPAPPLIERESHAVESQRGALDWQGPVRLAMDRAMGISAPRWQQQIRSGLLERAVVLGADHYGGPHLDRPETALRILAHIDALAEAGLSATELRSFAEEAELDHVGALWIVTLLFGCFGARDFSDEFEAWISALELTYDSIIGIADALRIVPNPQFRESTRRWLNSDSERCAIALELVSPTELPTDVLSRLVHHDDSFVQVAIERRLVRHPELDAALARRIWSWADATTPDCCYHAARSRVLRRDFEPLMRLRQGDDGVIEALGHYALEIMALAGDGTDLHRAAELVRVWPTTPRLLDSMGRIGLPSLFPRLLAELEGDFDDDAMRALTTALGPMTTTISRQHWEQAIEALPKLPDPTRLRGGKPYSSLAVLEEMAREDLSARDVQNRADELFVRTGKRLDIEWHALGLTLEAPLAAWSKVIR